MKSFIKQRPLLSYFVLAYALSWLLWIPAALVITSAEEPPEWTFLLVLLGIYGASGAGFIMTGIMDGRDGVRSLLRRVRIWRVGVQWYLVALLAVPTIYLLGLAIYALQGNPVGPFEPSHLPLLILTAIPALLFGPLGEEFGWRGFALPRMQLKFSAFWTSIILGVLHAFWHVPLFWAGGGTTVRPDAITVPAVGLFLSWVMIGTFIYTFILNNTWGSMLLAILMHWSVSFGAIIFGLFPALPESAQDQILLAAQIPGWIVVIVILAVFGPAHMSRKKPPQKYGLVEATAPTAES